MDRLMGFLNCIGKQVYAEKPSELHSHITRKSADELLKACPLRPGARILDVGCGQGPALEYFTRKGFFPVGVTQSDEDIEACKRQGFTVARMEQSFLDFEPETFDLVWARHVVEHSIFPLFTLDGFQRVIRDGGYLYLEVPAPDTSCHHEQNPNHYSVLTKSSWLSHLKRTGFEMVLELSYKFDVMTGPDEYWAFCCQKQRRPS
jgi:SAM-dependent methyltransferase